MTDKVIMTKAIFMDCANCSKRFGALIVEDNKLVNGDEVSQFLRIHEVIPLCVACHVETGVNGPTLEFEKK